MRADLHGIVSGQQRRIDRRWLLGSLWAAALLGGCGFQLRGVQRLGFDRVVLRPDAGGALAQELQAALAAAGVTVLPAGNTSGPVPVMLELQDERREKVVVSQNASGQVREFQLRIRVRLKLGTPSGEELVPSDEILQQRDFSYNESAALAKETEEALLFRDMQTDLVQQIMRRLASLKLPP